VALAELRTGRLVLREGLATEAAAEILRVAFEVVGRRFVHAGADPPDAAGFRVMACLGMTHEHTATVGGQPIRYDGVRR
jgi:RimJ/RimL family protein N-acetyltransferase